MLHNTVLINTNSQFNPSPLQSLLKIASINANTSLKNNLNHYISYINLHNIDILLVQESGLFFSANHTNSKGPDSPSQTLYNLAHNNLHTVTTWTPDTRYMLIIIFKITLFSLITKLHSESQHTQVIKLNTTSS